MDAYERRCIVHGFPTEKELHQFLLKRLKEIEDSPRHEVTPELWERLKAELHRRVQARRGKWRESAGRRYG